MKKYFTDVFVVFISLVLALAAAELFLRYVYTPDSVKIRLHMNRLAASAGHERQGLWGGFSRDEFRFAPGLTVTIAHQEFNYTTKHDAFGFRNPCATGRADVHIIGDSMIYGIGATDGSTWDCNLAVRGTKAYLSGIPGAGPEQYFKLIEKNNSRLVAGGALVQKPILVVSVFAGNDFEDLLNSIDEDGKRAAVGVEASDVRKASVMWTVNALMVTGALRNIHVAQLAKVSALKLLNMTPRPMYRNYNGSTFYAAREPSEPDIAKAERFFASLKDTASKHNYRKVMVMLIPEAADLSESRLRRDALVAGFDPHRINTGYKYSLLSQAARRAGLTLLDLRGSLSDERFYYEHDGHLTNAGVKAASDALGRTLEQMMAR